MMKRSLTTGYDVYEPVAVKMLDDGHLLGNSEALGLYVCWEEGTLRFFKPRTESYLRSQDEDVARTSTAEARVNEERAGRIAAAARAGTAESRVAELEEELGRLCDE